jgi:hypothetical protein
VPSSKVVLVSGSRDTKTFKTTTDSWAVAERHRDNICSDVAWVVYNSHEYHLSSILFARARAQARARIFSCQKFVTHVRITRITRITREFLASRASLIVASEARGNAPAIASLIYQESYLRLHAATLLMRHMRSELAPPSAVAAVRGI